MLLFKRKITLFISLLAFKLVAQEYAILRDISYYGKNIVDINKSKRCELDLYYPKAINNFPKIFGFMEVVSKQVINLFRNNSKKKELPLLLSTTDYIPR